MDALLKSRARAEAISLTAVLAGTEYTIRQG